MAKRWYFKFKTFQGHTCQVDIYDENFSGTAIELNKDVSGSPGCPADNPLVIEEDNSDNVLSNVRIKTGYVNLIELTSGGLQDMYPSENGEFEVYAFIDKPSNIDIPSDDADQYIIFHGYIQAQSFEQDYLSYRDKVKLPIQSVMGVLQEQPITRESNVVADILVECFSEYKYFVIPAINVTVAGESPRRLVEMAVAQCILTPINSDYNYGTHASGDTAPEPVIPLTRAEFMERLCNVFGLISHDAGNMLVFTKIGWTGDFIRYRNVAAWESSATTIGSGGTINTFSSLFDFSDKKSKISHVDSVHKLTKYWENMSLPVKVDFSVASDLGQHGNERLLKYEGFEIASNIWLNTSLSNIDNATYIVGDGENEYLESCRQSVSDYTLQFWVKMNYLNFANRIHLETVGYRFGTLGISIMNSEGLYYNVNAESTDDPWEESEAINDVTFSSITDGTADIDLRVGAESEITIFFYVKNNGNNCEHRFKKIELQDTFLHNKYSGDYYNPDKTVEILDSKAYNDAEINFDFMIYCNADWAYSFEHLRKSQRNLTLNVRKKSSAAITELQLLLGKFAMSATDQSNRVISTRHYVRDDEYELQVMGNQYF